MVSSLGTSGSNGSAFSLAILTIIRRKASDTVRPIAFSTAAASFLVCSSMRARTTELAVIAKSSSMGYNVAQHGLNCKLSYASQWIRGHETGIEAGDGTGREYRKP